jgi:hypothetical protein
LTDKQLFLCSIVEQRANPMKFPFTILMIGCMSSGIIGVNIFIAKPANAALVDMPQSIAGAPAVDANRHSGGGYDCGCARRHTLNHTVSTRHADANRYADANRLAAAQLYSHT